MGAPLAAWCLLGWVPRALVATFTLCVAKTQRGESGRKECLRIWSRLNSIHTLAGLQLGTSEP